MGSRYAGVQMCARARDGSIRGFFSSADYHIGRLIDALDQDEALDDTLIHYIIGDNGASAEGTRQGTFSEMIPFNGMIALEPLIF